MLIESYIEKQEFGRREILSAIHHIITEGDKKAIASVGTMMGKEMIIYKVGGVFKYGLSSVVNYMSLHAMPIYGSSLLHSKYVKLLDKAKFQKGCINFKSWDQMPLEIVRQLIEDCAKIDLAAIIENFKKNPADKYF